MTNRFYCSFLVFIVVLLLLLQLLLRLRRLLLLLLSLLLLLLLPLLYKYFTNLVFFGLVKQIISRVMGLKMCCAHSLQASPFLIEVYSEKCTPLLKATNIDIGGKILTNAVIEMVTKKVVIL